MPVPVLAIEIGTVISVAILIIGFLGWIRQQIAQNQPAAPPPKPPRRDDRVQNEIEIFLQEVGGKKPAGQRPQDDVAIEIVPEGERRARPTPPRPPRPPARRPDPPRPVREAPRPARGPLATGESALRPRPAAPQTAANAREAERVGASVLAHLQGSLDSGRFDKQVEERLKHEIGELAARVQSAASTPSVQGAAPAQRLASLLRSPSGMRQAILMNEILAPPMALRRGT